MKQSLQYWQMRKPCSSNMEKGKIYGKSFHWLSVLIYQTFKAFKEAMKYTLLFEATITKLKFFTPIFVLKIRSRSEQKW